MVSKFIYKALKNKPITVYGDGSQTRTFCYIDDNVEATTNAFYKNMYVNDVVNIGGDVEITILELAQTIIKLTNSESKIQHLAALEEGDMTRRRPDVKKMKKLLNRPMITLEEGMQKVLNQLDWIV